MALENCLYLIRRFIQNPVGELKSPWTQDLVDPAFFEIAHIWIREN